ncbi:MAG TPA: helix-turn-helix domain-containing protein [Phycisphaerae bacterium]|nr:helix-turn-helix domain-containing protein [Phycisphaerae bacterium]
MGEPSKAKNTKLDALLDRIELPGASPALLQETRMAAAEAMANRQFDEAGDAILTPAEAAALLRVDERTLRDNLADLPAFEFAGHVRFSRRALEEWIRQRTTDFGEQMARQQPLKVIAG